MIKDKTLYFGYGDISVGCVFDASCIIFRNIKPPCECGQTISKDLIREKSIEFIGEPILILVDDYDVYTLFKSINEDNKIIHYNGYTFDFTKYNYESIRVCMDAAKAILDSNLMLLAC